MKGMGTYFLQEIGDAFSVRASEPHGLEEVEDVFARALVNEVTIRQQNNIVEQVVGLGRWLEQRNDGGSFQNVDVLLKRIDDGIGCGAVEPRRDFVHEKSFRRSDDHLAGGHTLFLPARYSSYHFIAHHCVCTNFQSQNLRAPVSIFKFS